MLLPNKLLKLTASNMNSLPVARGDYHGLGPPDRHASFC